MNRIFRPAFTAEKLIEILKLYPPKAIVILSSDPEGNEFGVMQAIEQADSDRNVLILWPAESSTVEFSDG